jgi:CHASE2 domain-containing sensor protein
MYWSRRKPNWVLVCPYFHTVFCFSVLSCLLARPPSSLARFVLLLSDFPQLQELSSFVLCLVLVLLLGYRGWIPLCPQIVTHDSLHTVATILRFQHKLIQILDLNMSTQLNFCVGPSGVCALPMGCRQKRRWPL